MQWRHAANQPPSLFDKCTGLFYVRYTTHVTNGFASHPKDESSWYWGHMCHDWDSNPHSADQTHQSLSLIFLFPGPQHAVFLLWFVKIRPVQQSHLTLYRQHPFKVSIIRFRQTDRSPTGHLGDIFALTWYHIRFIRGSSVNNTFYINIDRDDSTLRIDTENLTLSSTNWFSLFRWFRCSALVLFNSEIGYIYTVG